MCQNWIRRLLLVTLFSGLISGCADTVSIQSRSVRLGDFSNKRTVAVVDFAGDYGGQAIADMLTLQLRKAGYQVVERDNLRRIVDEQHMGASDEGKLDLTEKERLELIGKNIAADLIITGNLVRFVPARYEREAEDRVRFAPATCELTARSVDAETGRVIWTCVVNVTAQSRNGQYIMPLSPITEACAELVESLRNPDYVDKSRSFVGPEIAAMRASRMIGS